MKENPNLFHDRKLDPNNEKSASKIFYSPDILDKIIEEYIN